MRHALDLGINWIDTAAVYGHGHSEEVIGRMLLDIPQSERPLIFTKCGLTWDDRNPMKEPRAVLKPEVIRLGCEASLRRLGVERIDLLQFHWPDSTGTPVEESWGELVRLIDEGKCGLWGYPTFPFRCSSGASAFATWIRYKHPFLLSNGMQREL